MRFRTARVISICIRRTAIRRPPTTALPPAFLRPYRGYQNIRMRAQFRRRELPCASSCRSTAATSRACSSAARTRWQRATRPGRRRSGQSVDRDQPAAVLLLRRAGAEPDAQRVDQLHLGHSGPSHGRAPRSCSTAGSCRDRTRSSAANGRRSLHDRRQLRLHRRRRRQATDLGGGLRVVRPDHRRRSDGRQRRPADRLVRHGRLQAAVGTRRLRRLAAQRRPAAGDQQLEPGDLQELRGRRTAGVPVPRRDLQCPERGSVHRHRSRRACSTRRVCRRRRLWHGARASPRRPRRRG